TAHSPPVPPLAAALGVPSLHFDPARGRLVMFRGDVTGEVWEYDGIDWTRLASASAPSPRLLAALVFDPPRQSALLFGGLLSSTDLADTWTWDGRRWALMAPAQSPGARSDHALAFDAARGVPLLFGGATYASSSPVTHDDTWTWNGNWLLAQPAHRP